MPTSRVGSSVHRPDRVMDVGPQAAPRPGGVLVADAPDRDRGMVRVPAIVLVRNIRSALARTSDVEEAALHTEDGDLGPDQDPVAVRQLQRVGVQRIVGARHVGAQLTQVAHVAPHLGWT